MPPRPDAGDTADRFRSTALGVLAALLQRHQSSSSAGAAPRKRELRPPLCCSSTASRRRATARRIRAERRGLLARLSSRRPHSRWLELWPVSASLASPSHSSYKELKQPGVSKLRFSGPSRNRHGGESGARIAVSPASLQPMPLLRRLSGRVAPHAARRIQSFVAELTTGSSPLRTRRPRIRNWTRADSPRSRHQR